MAKKPQNKENSRKEVGTMRDGRLESLMDLGLTASARKRLEQFEKIINVGRDLFSQRGSHGFSTHELAKRLSMSQGNVYNYVESKRELWLAIRREDYREYKLKLASIIENHQGPYIPLFKKLAYFFLDYARDERRKFQMMYLMSPPPSKKVGKIEKNYVPVYPQYLLIDVIEKAKEAGEIMDMDSVKFSLLMFSIIYGISATETGLSIKNPIQEPLLAPEDKINPLDFRDFALDITLDMIRKKEK